MNTTPNKLLINTFKKTITTLLVFSIITNLLIGCTFSHSNSNNPNISETQNRNEANSNTFSDYTYAMFADFFENDSLLLHSYVQHPENYGITQTEQSIGGYELDNLDNSKELSEALAKLEYFNFNQLDKQQQITYKEIQNFLETQLEYSDLYLFNTYLSSTIGIQVQLPLVFAEYSFNDEQDVINYLKLLEKTDSFFENIIEFERLRADKGYFMETRFADEIIEQCDTFISNAATGFLITTFEERLNNVSLKNKASKNEYISQNKEAISNHMVKGYQILKNGINELKHTNKYTGGLCNYPNGKKYYEYLLKDSLGWSKSVDELNSYVDTYLNLQLTNMRNAYQQDNQIINNLPNYTFNETQPEKVLNDLKTNTDKYFPESAKIDYKIKYIDKSLSNYASPAMYFTPQLDNIANNSIYLNPDLISDASIYPTLAHEGFPGHMYQITSFANSNPDPVRYVIGPIGYIEGWATYSEAFSYNFNHTQNASLNNFKCANNLFELILCAKIDIGVNYYNWGLDDVKKYLSDNGIVSADIANSIYDAVISEPENYCKYAIGYIALCELKNKYVGNSENPDDLKRFHRYVLNYGPVPFDMLFNNSINMDY